LIEVCFSQKLFPDIVTTGDVIAVLVHPACDHDHLHHVGERSGHDRCS